MEKLIPIIRTFDNYRLRHIDVLNNQNSKSRATELYHQIQKGKINSDDEAARFLFGKNVDKNSSKYRKFKSEFKNQVLNTLLFIDTDNEIFDEYQKATYEINREWMSIKTLTSRGMIAVAATMAEQLLHQVNKYDYADIAVHLLPIIKYGFAATGDKKSYSEYQKLHAYYLDLWLAEQKAREYHDLLKIEYTKTAAYKPQMSNIAKQYYEELQPYLDKYQSVALHFYVRLIEIYIYSTISDYKNLLDVTERGLTFFNSKSFKLRLAISTFSEQRMVALMMLKLYPEAYEAIDESLKMRISGSFNWFKAQESKVSLCFRMHNYTEAYTIYQEVTTMPDFKKVLTGMSREIWYVFNAHFHLMHKLGAAQGLKLAEKEFDFDAFLKDTPTFNQDKKGMHLPLLILEICFQMSAKTRDELIDRIEAFQKHLTRYTDKTDPSYRFNEFGRMLLEIPKSGFKRSILESNTAQLLKNLQSSQYNSVESIYRSEVVELEELWELVLSNYESLK